MLDSIGPFNVSAEGQAGFRTIRREPSQLKNQIKDLGVTIAKNMVDSLLEGFMDAITKDPKFNDEMTISSKTICIYQSIMSSMLTQLFIYRLFIIKIAKDLS